MTERAPTLRIAGRFDRVLKHHLFPGDDLEAAAILVCSRFGAQRSIFAVREIVLVPHESCEVRERDRISWPGEYLERAIDLAEADGASLFLIHSHPGGLFAFSGVDDRSDAVVIPGIAAAIDAEHGTAIMTPDGAVRARVYSENGVTDLDLVTVAGDDIIFCWRTAGAAPIRRPMAFTSDMTAELKRLTAFVVGVSGTGSVTAEQVYRMGFGRVGLVDPDRVEGKNLNRILNSTAAAAARRALKVQMFAAAAKSYAPNAETLDFPTTILDRDAVVAVAEADVLFCCVDSHDGRQVCDLISAAFCIPLIDMGVQIPVGAAGAGTSRIAGVYGRIDYVQPGGSSLEDRQVYTAQSVAEEYVARVAPDQHAAEVRDGYMKGRAEEAPSVISLNMRAASAAVLEFVARAYPFRHGPNRSHARTLFNVADGEEDHFAEDEFECTENPLLGAGLREPLLGLPALTEKRVR